MTVSFLVINNNYISTSFQTSFVNFGPGSINLSTPYTYVSPLPINIAGGWKAVAFFLALSLKNAPSDGYSLKV